MMRMTKLTLHWGDDSAALVVVALFAKACVRGNDMTVAKGYIIIFLIIIAIAALIIIVGLQIMTGIPFFGIVSGVWWLVVFIIRCKGKKQLLVGDDKADNMGL